MQTLKLLPLCRFIWIFFCDHLQLLCGFTRIFFDTVFLCACFGNILIWPKLFYEILLMPGLNRSVVHWRWTWHRCQYIVVDRTAVFLQPISVPRMVLQPVLNRCPSVLISFLLMAAPRACGALRGVTEPPPAEPQDLLHIKLFLSRYWHFFQEKKKTKAYSFRKEMDSLLSLVFQLLFLRKDNKRTNTGSSLPLSSD